MWLNTKMCVIVIVRLTGASTLKFIVSNNASDVSRSGIWPWLKPTGFSSITWLPVDSNARVVVDTCCLAFAQSCEVMRISIISMNIISLGPAFWIQRKYTWDAITVCANIEKDVTRWTQNRCTINRHLPTKAIEFNKYYSALLYYVQCNEVSFYLLWPSRCIYSEKF